MLIYKDPVGITGGERTDDKTEKKEKHENLLPFSRSLNVQDLLF
jgi:hypothetical protein